MSEPLPLRIAALQTAPSPGDFAANVRDVAAASVDADLIVTPELSLTGYDLRDEVHEVALPLRAGEASPAELAGLGGEGAPAVIAGLVERGADAVPYNSAVAISGGRILHVHRKVYLPTYGLFDEGRWFGRGRSVETFELGGWRLAILICEDLWHPSLVLLAALAGADALVVPAAAPGRGVLEGGNAEAWFESAVAWRELARVSARTHGVYVILTNRAGVEDGITFAGGSMIVAPDGTVLAEAPAPATGRIAAVLDPAERARARRPYAHIRDEDPRLLAAALAGLGVRA